MGMGISVGWRGYLLLLLGVKGVLRVLVRVRNSCSEVGMGKCFCGSDTLGGIELQKAFQQINRCGPISIERSRIIE